MRDKSEDHLTFIVHSSLLRIASSQHSLTATGLLLDRSRRTIQKSIETLRTSQCLVNDPFRRSWNRRSAGRSQS